MQIRITNHGDSTNVQVVNPSTDEVSSNLGLAKGEQVTITAPDVHEADGLQVGDVETFETGEAPAADQS